MIKHLVIHNSGGLINNPYASTQHLSVKDIDTAHKIRWGVKSSMGWYCGYTIVIEANGKLTQTRAIGEEGIHAKGHNFDSIGILLMGNFTAGVDQPTFPQELALKNLLIRLLNKNFEGLNIFGQKEIFYNNFVADIKDIVPHRALCETTCYGSGLTDDWARNLVKGYYKEQITLLQSILETLKNIFKTRKQLGAVVPSSCIDEDNRG